MKTPRRRLLGLVLVPFAAPIAAWAQQRKPWRIGYLAQASPQVGAETLGEFKRGLAELGYAEGRQYVIEVRNAEGQPERLDQFAIDLVRLRVDVIVAGSTPPAHSLMKATRSIPIVVAISGDPVGSGLVQSLARPGGNVTGTALAFEEVSRKWLELLITVRGDLARVAVLSNPTNESMRSMLDPLQSAARDLNLGLSVHDWPPGGDPSGMLDRMRRERADGLIVLPDAYLRTQLPHIADFAVRMRIPAVYGNRPYVEAGGLMSYGPNQSEHYRRAAAYVDKILKGAKPADLPVERPTRFEFVINLKSAKAAGLAIPASLLARADRVIE